MPTPSDWPSSQARWIRRPGSPAERNSITHFARVLDAPAGAALRLLVTANSAYQATINGRWIGRGPGAASPQYRTFDMHEIPAEWLLPRGNVLAIVVQHDGAAPAADNIQGFEHGDPGLLACVLGGGVEVVTDGSWRCRRAPEFSPIAHLVSKWGGHREYFHGERVDGWREPGFDHSAWETAEVVGPPITAGHCERLVARDIPALEEFVQAPARVASLRDNLGSIRATPGGTFLARGGEPGACPAVVVDFGAVTVGYPEITTSGGDCVYEVWYGETMDLTRLDCVSRPGDPGTWRALQRRSFRYLMVQFVMLQGEVSLDAVALRVSRYAYQQDRALELPDARLQRMVDVSIATLRTGTSTHYEDCAWREQALWVLDGRIMGLLNTYLFGNPELNARGLRQSFAIQREDGHVAATGPRDNAMFHHDFPMHLVGWLREHFQHTGDSALVRELHPALLKLDGFYARLRDDDGLLDVSRVPGLSPPHLDWSNEIDRSGRLCILNALFKLMLEDRAFLERHALGDEAAAAALEAEAARVAIAARQAFFLPDETLFADSVRPDGSPTATRSQQASYAAIRARLVEGDEALAVHRALRGRQDLVQPFGPSFYLQIVEALDAIGQHEEMRRILDWYWGAMLDRGATTWWEVFDPRTPGWMYPHPFLGNTPTYEMEWIPVSTCHGWSGIPGYAIPRFLLGVDLSRAWLGEVRVNPGLPAARAGARYRTRLMGQPLELRLTHDGAEAVELPAGMRLVQGAHTNAMALA